MNLRERVTVIAGCAGFLALFSGPAPAPQMPGVLTQMPDEAQCKRTATSGCPSPLDAMRETLKLQGKAILQLHADLEGLEKRIQLLESGDRNGR